MVVLFQDVGAELNDGGRSNGVYCDYRHGCPGILGTLWRLLSNCKVQGQLLQQL